MCTGTTEEEDEVIRNWRPPQKTEFHSAEEDHSAHAGKHERAVLTELGFVMKLEGRDIKVGNGIDEKGFLDSKVLQLWGVKNYTHLWGNDVDNKGKVVEKAREMSRRNQRVKLEKCVEELDKALSRRQKDMKGYAARRKLTITSVAGRVRKMCVASASARPGQGGIVGNAKAAGTA